MPHYHWHQVQGKTWLPVEMRRSLNSTYHTLKEVRSPKDSRNPHFTIGETNSALLNLQRAFGEVTDGEAEIHVDCPLRQSLCFEVSSTSDGSISSYLNVFINRSQMRLTIDSIEYMHDGARTCTWMHIFTIILKFSS